MYDRAHDNFVNCLQWKAKFAYAAQEDAAGNIWLSLEDSLVRYDPVTKRSEGFSSKAKGKYQLDAENFYDIYKDKKQRIWVCSTNGLYEYNAKENVFIAHLSHADSLKQITAVFIREDAQQPGIFYFDGYNTYPFGSNEAFCRYNSNNTGSLTLFHHKAGDANSIANNRLTGLYTDSKGRLWVSNYGGLSLFDLFTCKKLTFTIFLARQMHLKILMLISLLKKIKQAIFGAIHLKACIISMQIKNNFNGIQLTTISVVG